MTNYRDKFLGNKTVKINTKELERKQEAFLDEEIQKVSDLSMSKIENEIESTNFVQNFNKLSRRIYPVISYKDPKTFAFYGSAKFYYEDGFENITSRYPYDGSRNERISWAISASALDTLLLEHVYPKSTGHLKFSPNTIGTQTGTSGLYRLTDKVEYVTFAGGPRVNSTYDSTKRMGTNLTINPDEGNTVEFWLKKESFGHSFKEVVLDVTTPSYASGSNSYGRFLIELTGSGGTGSPFVFSYVSASSGFVNQSIGSSITSATVADNAWHHYALSIKNVDSKLRARLYVDGVLNHTITSNQTVSAVNSNTTGFIGALGVENKSTGGLGWGKLSGSIDEFRFWRAERNPKEIGIFYDKPVFGGTAKDSTNPDLSIYYKFNEGVTTDAAIDSIVLDYSGRINNGDFVGYKQENRSTESAITLSPNTKEKESADPIVAPTHPDVVSVRSEYSKIGSAHDVTNPTSLAKSLPQWVYDEGVFGANNQDSEMGILVQAIASEFDSIKTLIDNAKRINSKDTQDFFDASSNIEYENKYLFGCSEDFQIFEAGKRDNSELADFALSRESFFVENYPISEEAEYLEYFYSISEDFIFDKETLSIKDKILKNIHKNLVHIYKTKGTEESFRNMIRCFGIGEDLVRLNVYANNEEREIKNDPIYTTIPKKVVSFEGNNQDSNIIQMTSSAIAGARSFISGTQNITPWSAEGSFIFPRFNERSSVMNSSLYGAGQAQDTSVSSSAGGSAAVAASGSITHSGTPGTGSVITLNDGEGDSLSEVEIHYRKDYSGHFQGPGPDQYVTWTAIPVYTEITQGGNFGGAAESTGGFAQCYITPRRLFHRDADGDYNGGTYNGMWRTHWSTGGSEPLQLEILDAAGQILYIKFDDVASYDSPVTTATSNRASFDDKVKRNGVRDYSVSTRFTDRGTNFLPLQEWLYNVAIAIADAVERNEIKLQIPEFTRNATGDPVANNIAENTLGITYYNDTNSGPIRALRIAADSKVLGDGTGSPLGVRIAPQSGSSWTSLASDGALFVATGQQDTSDAYGDAPMHYWNGRGPTWTTDNSGDFRRLARSGGAIHMTSSFDRPDWLFAPGGMPGGYLDLELPGRSPAQHTLTTTEIAAQTTQIINNLPVGFQATLDGSTINIASTTPGASGNTTTTTRASSNNVTATNMQGGQDAVPSSAVYDHSVQLVFNVSSIKHSSKGKHAYFKLTSSAGHFPELTSSYYPDVYDNSKWNFAVVASKDSNIPLAGVDTYGYNIEFIGKQYDLDVLRNSFHLSASITQAQYEYWSKYNKHFYMGAQRQFLTGAVVNAADTRGIFLNVWADHISDNEITEHAINVDNYGRENPQFFSSYNNGENTQNANTLALSWHFDDNPLFSSNTLTITDSSSGSLENINKYGDVLGHLYPGRSTNFANQATAIKQDHIVGVEYAEIDNAYTSDRVKIKDDEFEKFEIDSRPTTYTFSFEKSMYQIISKEMLNFVAGLASYNNLIGEPVNKYRQEYKALQKLSDRFFSTVKSDVDLDKFVEYYKWVDSSLGSFLTALQPASSRMRTDLKNMVESHALERNKYQHPFPTIEYKEPDTVRPILGINELLYDWEHGHAPVGFPPIAAKATITTTGNPSNNEEFSLTDADGLTVTYIFKTGVTTVDGTKTAGKVIIGVQGASGHAPSIGDRIRAAIIASDINVTVVETTGGSMTLTQNTPGVSGNTSIDMSSVTTTTATNFSGGRGTHGEDTNCLWQKDRREHTEARNALRDRIVTQVSGSTYVLRNLTKPYKYSVDRQDFLVHGSNRKANKIDDFYKVINSGREITLKKEDIYEFRKCDDPVNPQRERIYQTKADTSDTGGYLDADGDLIFPFTLYSSSAGNDFANFKQNLKITNNHDDIESSWIQSPFVAAHNGGMPHRRVPFGTENKDRPEAYDIVSTSSKLTIKSTTQKPKSMFYRDSSAGRLMNVSNVKQTTGSLLLGNYTKDYEIVMTNGRSSNNNYFVDTEGSFLGSSVFADSKHISGAVDFVVPNRGKTEHVIVNRFSSPGGPDSMSPSGLDRIAEEFSIYNTINYRNSMVRTARNTLFSEHSERHGFRSGSTKQASIHMTNRNPSRFTGSLGDEFNYDNFFVQHPIPQNDFGYSWITASATDSVYEFLNKNANIGHQHNFNVAGTLDSKETITFLGSSQSQAQLSFVGLNQFVVSSVNVDTNTLSGPGLQSLATYLNDQILNFQGPYGWPSWKQTRGDSHPVMRQHRKNNTFSIILKGSIFDASAKSEYDFDRILEQDNQEADLVRTIPRGIKNYKDMPITSRFSPISMTKHRLRAMFDGGQAEIRSFTDFRPGNPRSYQYFERGLWFGDEYLFDIHTQTPEISLQSREGTDFYNGSISLRATLANDVTTYSNRQIIKDFDIEEIKSSKKDKFMSLLGTWFPEVERVAGAEYETELREINYIETIYPKEINTYTKNARTRQDFVFHGWKALRNSRETFLTGNILYGHNGAYTGHSGLAVFPDISIVNDKDFVASSMGRVDAVNIASVSSIIPGPHITSSVWPLDARKDFSSLPLSIDLSFRTGKEKFLQNNTQASRGEGLFQNDYGIFAMGYNGLYGTPPVSMTYNRRFPQVVELYNTDFEDTNDGAVPAGWSLTAASVVRVEESSTGGNKVLAFVGAPTTASGFATGRLIQFDTWITGSTTAVFDLFTFGDVFSDDYGITQANGHGTLSQMTPDDGDTFNVYYALKGSPSTWVLAESIPYEASLTTEPKRKQVTIPVGNDDVYRIRLHQAASAGFMDKWGIDNFLITKNVLSGEAKFQTADSKLGPFYDSYEDYRDEIRRVGQDHSIVPEFRISDFVEEYYNPNNPGDTSRIRNEFLSLTGAVHHTSSGDLQVGSQFFKSYGHTEFMKYFEPLRGDLAALESQFLPTRLTLRCQAAMKFLPYKGFFPAERVEQIGEIFARSYMPSGSYNFDINDVHATTLTNEQKERLIERRIEASKQQVMKPLFGPGILNNSIKAGLAVDYPIFNTNYETVYSDLEALSGNQFFTGSISNKTVATAVIKHIKNFPLQVGDRIVITSLEANGSTKEVTYTAAASENTSDSNNMRFNKDNTLTSLRACILHSNGHNGVITVTAPISDGTMKAGVVSQVESISLSQTIPGQAGNIEITSVVAPINSVGQDPIGHFGFTGGTGGGALEGLTGSFINHSEDTGIPRIKGDVSRRLTFEDVLYIDDLYGVSVPDNEPHPEASLLYGNSMWNKVIERPPTFGKLNRINTLQKVGVDFSENRSTFGLSMTPFKSAMHNFAAETVSFFMKDQKLETVMTPPIKLEIEDNRLVGQEYKMRVYLQNANTMMYDRHSAFGPPVDDGTNEMVFYETGAPVQASGPLTIAGSVTALTAAKNGVGTAAPTHAELSSSANPRIVLKSIDSKGLQNGAGSVIFYDPANYYQTIRKFATASITLNTNPHAPIMNAFSAHASTTATGFSAPASTGGSGLKQFKLDDHTSTTDVRFYDPNDYIRYSQFSMDNNTAEAPAKFQLNWNEDLGNPPTWDFNNLTDPGSLFDRHSNASATWGLTEDGKLPGFNISQGGSTQLRIRYYNSDNTTYKATKPYQAGVMKLRLSLKDKENFWSRSGDFKFSSAYNVNFNPGTISDSTGGYSIPSNHDDANLNGTTGDTYYNPLGNTCSIRMRGVTAAGVAQTFTFHFVNLGHTVRKDWRVTGFLDEPNKFAFLDNPVWDLTDYKNHAAIGNDTTATNRFNLVNSLSIAQPRRYEPRSEDVATGVELYKKVDYSSFGTSYASPVQNVGRSVLPGYYKHHKKPTNTTGYDSALGTSYVSHNDTELPNSRGEGASYRNDMGLWESVVDKTDFKGANIPSIGGDEFGNGAFNGTTTTSQKNTLAAEAAALVTANLPGSWVNTNLSDGSNTYNDKGNAYLHAQVNNMIWRKGTEYIINVQDIVTRYEVTNNRGSGTDVDNRFNSYRDIGNAGFPFRSKTTLGAITGDTGAYLTNVGPKALDNSSIGGNAEAGEFANLCLKSRASSHIIARRFKIALEDTGCFKVTNLNEQYNTGYVAAGRKNAHMTESNTVYKWDYAEAYSDAVSNGRDDTNVDFYAFSGLSGGTAGSLTNPFVFGSSVLDNRSTMGVHPGVDDATDLVSASDAVAAGLASDDKPGAFTATTTDWTGYRGKSTNLDGMVFKKLINDFYKHNSTGNIMEFFTDMTIEMNPAAAFIPEQSETHYRSKVRVLPTHGEFGANKSSAITNDIINNWSGKIGVSGSYWNAASSTGGLTAHEQATALPAFLPASSDFNAASTYWRASIFQGVNGSLSNALDPDEKYTTSLTSAPPNNMFKASFLFSDRSRGDAFRFGSTLSYNDEVLNALAPNVLNDGSGNYDTAFTAQNPINYNASYSASRKVWIWNGATQEVTSGGVHESNKNKVSRRNVSAVPTFYINARQMANLTQIKDQTQAVIEGFLEGSNGQTYEGQTVTFSTNLTSDAQENTINIRPADPNASAALSITATAGGGSFRLTHNAGAASIFRNDIESSETQFVAGTSDTIVKRAQWSGTNATNRTTTGATPGGNNPFFHTNTFGSNQRDNDEKRNLVESDSVIMISGRNTWETISIGSSMPSTITPIQVSSANSVGIVSNSGEYAVAFNGARGSFSDKPNFSHVTKETAVPANFNGFTLTNARNSPFVVQFDFCHVNTSGDAKNYTGLSTSNSTDAKIPKTSYDYGDSYSGYDAGEAPQHLWAQYSTNGGTNWTTVMEIAPNTEFSSWNTGGFAIDSTMGVSNSTSIKIRILTSGATTAATGVWLIRNIILHRTDSSSGRTRTNIISAMKAKVNANASLDITATDITNGLKFTQDNFGTNYNKSIGTSGAGAYGGSNIIAASSDTAFSGGDEYNSYYDVETSQPGPDTTNNIRYCKIRSTGSASGTYTTEQLRNHLKSEVDQLISSSGLTLTTATESTNKIILTQVYGGDPGNNDPGPGELTPMNGTTGTDLSKVLTDTANSKFTGGGVSTEGLHPVTRSVPNMHGFMPYVPPYLDRNASPYVEYTFIPRRTGAYTAMQVVDQLTASYVNFHKVPANASSNTNYKQAMSISASLNLTEIVTLQRDLSIVGTDPEAREATIDPNFARRWAIQPKWETPVHNFFNVSADALRLSTPETGDVNNIVVPSSFPVDSLSSSPWKTRQWQKYYEEFERPTTTLPYLTASRGMWHQFGSSLNDSLSGYYLRIEDVGDLGLATAVGFLESNSATLEKPGEITGIGHVGLQQRGQKSLSVKLGKIAKKKEISEAVVAIPYFVDGDCKINFFDLNPESYQEAKENIESEKDHQIERSLQTRNPADVAERIKDYEKKASFSNSTATSTIEYQLRMMEKYILPPVFDFRLVDDEETMNPFVMYFFEFNAELNEKDLSNIWQNIYPESSDSTASPRYSHLSYNDPSKKDVVYSSHILDSTMVHRLTQSGDNAENLSNYNNPGEFVFNEVRWLVFKCKFRAETDYSFIKDRSIEPTVYFEKRTEDLSRPESIKRRNSAGALSLPIAYNWPYDYFSFVELIKLESKVDFYSTGRRRKKPRRRPRRNR